MFVVRCFPSSVHGKAGRRHRWREGDRRWGLVSRTAANAPQRSGSTLRVSDTQAPPVPFLPVATPTSRFPGTSRKLISANRMAQPAKEKSGSRLTPALSRTIIMTWSVYKFGRAETWYPGSAPAGRGVAQSWTLLYRRLAVGRAPPAREPRHLRQSAEDNSATQPSAAEPQSRNSLPNLKAGESTAEE